MAQARFLTIILFMVLFGIRPTSVVAQSDTLVSSDKMCAEIPTELQNEILTSVRTTMLTNYGNIAKDSIESLCSAMSKAFLAKNFFLQTIDGAWTPESISLEDKLKSILKDSNTQADSIETLCHWIGSRYPFGDPDVDPNFAQRSADSTWNLMDHGNLRGLCGEIASFFSKIVESRFSHWGTPIQFCSVADTSITHGGRGLPSHIWIGLSKEDGEIYAVCDPTLGGVVKDNPTGKLLSLSEVYRFLCDSDNALHLYIQNTTSSLQTYGAGCIPSIMLMDNTTPVYYNTPIEIVEAHWRGLDASSSHCVPYWHQKGLHHTTYMNVYLDVDKVWAPQYAADLLQKVQQRYHLNK